MSKPNLKPNVGVGVQEQDFVSKLRATQHGARAPMTMGIVNLTPDSFYKNSQVASDAVLSTVSDMIEQGVDIIDLGGESTAPNSSPITEDEELNRVIPALECIKKHFSIPVSVDTSRVAVMERAISYGVTMINDVRALIAPGAIDCLKKSATLVCLMHMAHPDRSGAPEPAQSNQTMMNQVQHFLQARVASCVAGGIEKSRLLIDPGFGAGEFGKSMQNNLYMLGQLSGLVVDELPMLVGVSRKTFIRECLQVIAEEALPGSLAATVFAVQNGASIIRTHDVKATREVIQMTYAITKEQSSDSN